MKILTILMGALLAALPVRGQENVEAIVAQNIRPILPANGKGGGVAVAVRINGETRFFNYGLANDARNERVTADSIFNLGSVGKLFATTTLAEAVKRGELSLDDPVAKYVTELQRGGDIRRITLGELASHTSGLPDRPGQYERWHRGKYTWPDFVRFLNSWKADPKHEPGKQYLYSDTAMVLLRIALQRRFNTPFAQLMHQRITGPLGMSSTALPLPRDLLGRAVQGYSPQGQPSGKPGMEGGTFQWRGSGQIYSSARDMATFLAANMGELADHGPIESAMGFAQQPVFKISPRLSIGLAWQVVSSGNLSILDKNGGLNNTSTYVGFAPQRKLAEVNNTRPGLADRSYTHSRKKNQSPRTKENRIRTRIDSPRQLRSSAAHGFNHFADCIDHELRLFLMYFVAALRVGNVLFVRHKLGESFLCFLLCGICDIAEVRRDIGW
jgi:beta-lactamase class C